MNNAQGNFEPKILEQVLQTKTHYENAPFEFGPIREQVFGASLTKEVLEHTGVAGKIIVDVGCSTAFLGGWLKAHHPDAVYLGIDINPAAVRLARAKGLNVREGNALRLDVPDQYADIVISEGVIHHTPAPWQAFRELIRITRRGGLISLYVYHRYHPYMLLYRASVLVRMLYRTAWGKIIVRRIIFPLFYAGYIKLGARLLHLRVQIPRDTAWSIFADQILTPIAHFFSRNDILTFARQQHLALVQEKKSINKQGLMFVFRREA